MRTWLVLLLAACNSGGGDDYAISPGGGGVSPTGGVIRPIDANDGDGGVTGRRVCVVTDLRTPFLNCATDGFAGLTVTVGTSTAITEKDGSFTIALPVGDNNVWHVTSPVTAIHPIVRIAMPYSGQFVIPAITDEVFTDLVRGNGIQQIENLHGSVVVLVVHGVLPLVGVGATLNPISGSPVLYDADNSATIWDQNRTNTHGVILAANLDVTGLQGVTLTPMTGTPKTISVSVEDQSLTFVTQDLP